MNPSIVIAAVLLCATAPSIVHPNEVDSLRDELKRAKQRISELEAEKSCGSRTSIIESDPQFRADKERYVRDQLDKQRAAEERAQKKFQERDEKCKHIRHAGDYANCLRN